MFIHGSIRIKCLCMQQQSVFTETLMVFRRVSTTQEWMQCLPERPKITAFKMFLALSLAYGDFHWFSESLIMILMTNILINCIKYHKWWNPQILCNLTMRKMFMFKDHAFLECSFYTNHVTDRWDVNHSVFVCWLCIFAWRYLYVCLDQHQLLFLHFSLIRQHSKKS